MSDRFARLPIMLATYRRFMIRSRTRVVKRQPEGDW